MDLRSNNFFGDETGKFFYENKTQNYKYKTNHMTSLSSLRNTHELQVFCDGLDSRQNTIAFPAHSRAANLKSENSFRSLNMNFSLSAL